MPQYLLGIDNGGTYMKAVLFDTVGNEIASASGQTPMITPKSGFTERDMTQLWEVNHATIKKTIEKAGIDPADIAGISLSGHGKGMYLWGYDEKPAYNGIISTDSRAWAYPKMLKENGVADKVFEKTYQTILACQPVSLIRWFMDNQPEVIEKTKWIFGVKDYIRYCLTGEATAEITDFSGSNLVNLATAGYDKELLDLLEIGCVYDKLPPLKYSTEICGHVTAEAAAKTGLVAGTPVAGGMFDIDACAIAMDITDEENLCVIAGTWSINEYISKTPVLDKTVMMNSLYCMPGYYLIEESSPTSASNNEWYCKTFLKELEQEAKDRGVSIYKLADEIVEQVAPDEQNIIFLPYIFGANYNPQAKASIIGVGSNNTKAQITRAVFEGIVFGHRVHCEKLLAHREKTKAVRLAGGAANSKVWVQMFADVLGLPVEIIATKELGALGCAMAAAVAGGTYKDLKEAAKHMVKVAYTVQPNPANVEIYNKKFKLYEKISGALDSYWSEF